MDGPPRRLSICDDEACWVCLEGPSESAGSLEYPCSCPRGVHAKCLARWQLQSAGREEERYCRFCKSELPDWRDILTPKVPAAPPVMAIVYDGKVVRLQVKPGKEGMEEFQRQVRLAFNLADDVELDCVFDCRAPGTGEKIKLRGLESYSAAMHCAAVAAGERLAKMKGSGSGGGSTSRRGCGSAGGTSGALTPSPPLLGTLPPPSTPRPTPAFAPMPLAASGSAPASPALPRISQTSAPPAGGPQSHHALAACPLPRLQSPRRDAGEACGAVPPPAVAAATSPGGRRRHLLSGLFRSLSSARRVM